MKPPKVLTQNLLAHGKTAQSHWSLFHFAESPNKWGVVLSNALAITRYAQTVSVLTVLFDNICLVRCIRMLQSNTPQDGCSVRILNCIGRSRMLVDTCNLSTFVTLLFNKRASPPQDIISRQTFILSGKFG